MKTDEKEPKTKQHASEDKKQDHDDAFEQVSDFLHKGKAKITERLEELENEWDIERIIHLHVSGISIAGALLGYFLNKRWLILPALAAVVLILHSMKGVAPQIPLLRKLGFRTRQEISREKYSLKAMRGDFKQTGSADKIWEAAL
jgi:hypothetical protein